MAAKRQHPARGGRKSPRTGETKRGPGKKGFAKPGSTVTRKVTKGPGKGDTVKFKANSPSAREPGKLKPRRVVKDVPPKGTQKTVPKRKPGKRKKR